MELARTAALEQRMTCSINSLDAMRRANRRQYETPYIGSSALLTARHRAGHVGPVPTRSDRSDAGPVGLEEAESGHLNPDVTRGDNGTPE